MAAEKYERKLDKALRKLHTAEANDDAEDMLSLRVKVEKYERKIKQLATPSTSDDVDKSGMSLLLFYAYVEPAWSPVRHKDTLHWAEGLLNSLGVTGRLRVSREGFNGTLTGPYDGIRAFTDAMRLRDNGYFAHMNNQDDFKITDNLPEGQAFPKLKVFAVTELVNYGLGVDNAPSVNNGGVHLEPKQYHQKLLEDNTVVIDIRNSYEADIGRFAPPTGAEYIDPKMRVSTEFPAWAKDNIDRLKDKQVLMYCTGGIRCERASALFRSLGHDKVFQLKGGIHNYLTEYASQGGGLWVGKNYTFDKRFAHGATEDDDKKDADIVEAPTSDEIVGKCVACSKPWDKYRGRKRCPVPCGVPLLLCNECLASDVAAKCFLCQEDAHNGTKDRFNKRQHYNQLALKHDNVPRDDVPRGKKVAVHACGVCKETFTSRNGLFKHVRATGHADRKAKKQKVAA
ncbi:hypothetical protein H257_14872 [Aphanomyces astaci]|uniref:Rhodanese domain-containing protein n=1 Tax=Aphanomyces astaci TaxID=112090 RepID=W4FPU3_APHAT|nr:hypothetical protein H257_14872 [Aphanomyces astaci]ETV69507.1 hypothetical protein H257_14872 [Aphanomyces astaci]|eukprot:XP_009841080.1 hypothetical protein H257_14872 [Aphanomyces astaci]